MAGGHFADHFQCHRDLCNIGGEGGVAVHRGQVFRRLGPQRHEIGGEDATRRIHQRYGGFGKGLNTVQNTGQRVCNQQQRRHAQPFAL
jgi:hypothetical protein